MHGSSCSFVGVDIWSQALERALSKQSVYQLPHLLLVRASGDRLPLANAEFDLIVSNVGVNNFADASASLAECFRVARPQARIVLTTNLKGHMHEFYEVYRETLVELEVGHLVGKLNAQESHRATRKSLEELLKKSGFRVTRGIEERFPLRFLDGSALLRHSLVFFGFLEGWREVVDARDEERIFAALESNLNRLAQEKGELSMTVPTLYLEGIKE